tara:strand:- start:195 stop:437 length:243 start_codon:yes stop_codon:yes gene_type:complete
MGLFKGQDLIKKTTGDLYYLQSHQGQHDKFLRHHPYFSLYQKLIPQGDHLIKGCRVDTGAAEPAKALGACLFRESVKLFL